MWDRFFWQLANIWITLSCMHWYVRKIESIIGVQWGQKNPNPRAHRSSGKRGLPSSPLNGGPEGWDFSGTTEHQWSILFLIYHDCTVQYCVFLLVTSLRSMLTVNDARCKNQLETANKQRIKQWTNAYFIKMDLQELAYQPQYLE